MDRQPRPRDLRRARRAQEGGRPCCTRAESGHSAAACLDRRAYHPGRRPRGDPAGRAHGRARAAGRLHGVFRDVADPAAARGERLQAMTKTQKLFLWIGAVYIGLIVIALIVFGSVGKNTEFKPQNEFKLDTWINLPGPFDINKAVLYLLLAAILTTWTMIYVARRMQQRPNRVQTAVETIYAFMRDNITRGNMSDEMARKWFPFLGALFLFIWYSNLIGFIPLPTNTEEKFNFLGAQIPSFAIYAATANLSIPLAFALVVFISYTAEGVRAKGPIGYLKSLIPSGVKGPMAGFIFVLELLSNFMRIISLSVRLFANMLAGHLIILFMAGGLAILLGVAAIGVFLIPLGFAIYVFEVGLVATLQAFIFATLSAIYLGGSVAESH